MKKLFPNLMPLYETQAYTFDDIRPFLLQDKKNKSGVRMSLLKSPGHCETQVMVSDQQIQDSFF